MSAEATNRYSARVKLQEVLASLSPAPEPESVADLLEVVKSAQEIEAQARQLLHMSVLTARRADATWTEVGKTLGISKQAAQKRFTPPKNLPAHDLHPEERFLGPVGMLDEMEELNLAGRYGWHSVDFGISHHHVVHSKTQWEHRRVIGTKKVDDLEAEGWVVFGRSFPYTLLKKDTGIPAHDEPQEPGGICQREGSDG